MYRNTNMSHFASATSFHWPKREKYRAMHAWEEAYMYRNMNMPHFASATSFHWPKELILNRCGFLMHRRCEQSWQYFVIEWRSRSLMLITLGITHGESASMTDVVERKSNAGPCGPASEDSSRLTEENLASAMRLRALIDSHLLSSTR
jgi:hypothetical protein